MSKRNVLWVFAFSLLLGLSPLAADPVIRRGIDVFTTPADAARHLEFLAGLGAGRSHVEQGGRDRGVL